MSFQDRLAAQDALQLLTIASGLSLTTAVSTMGKGYNFPLILFGLVAHETHSSTILLRQFLLLTLFTIPLDLYFIIIRLDGLPLLFTLLIVLLKIPIYVTCNNKLRERGGELQFGFPGNMNGGSGGWGFQGLPNSGAGGGSGNRAEQGNSNWTMPGGFSQSPNLPRPQSNQAPPPAPPPGQFPSSGGFRLGGEEDDRDDNNSPPPPPPGKGGYHTIA